jgi:glycosyltransferase involved in cell wall biosynthesis
MPKLNVIGFMQGTSGYASHTRQLVNALYRLNPEISIKTQLSPGYENELNGNEVKMVEQKPFTGANILAVVGPPQWPVSLCNGNSKFLGYCIWEGSNIPGDWLEYFTDFRISKILVPSNHTRQAALNTINRITDEKTTDNRKILNALKKDPDLGLIKDKILVVPHGVDTKIFRPRQKNLTDGIFRFMANKGWNKGMNDRGGIQYLIKAFNEEFDHNEPVELLIKINPAYNDGKWDLTNEIRKLNLRNNGGRISISKEAVTFDQLSVFYNFGNVFVSPNMSEGFGLPITEAMACGLPAITTNYGGQTDFVSENNGWLIDYRLIPVEWDPLYKDVMWAKPDMIHLRSLMRYAYEHPEEVKVKGIQASKDIESLTWDNSAEMVLKILNE